MIDRFARGQGFLAEADETVIINVYSRSNSIDDTSLQQQRDQRHASFMYFLLFIDILRKMPSSRTKSIENFVEFYREQHSGNEERMEKLRSVVQDYDSNCAIYCYTQESLLYRLLNQALRDQDYETLYSFQFFILDLCVQLTNEHENFLRSFDSDRNSILCVYRGQAICIDELNLLRNSIGKFISFSSFLSASTDLEYGLFYAEMSTTITDDVKRILFEIDIDTRLGNTKAYSDVKHLSHFSEENEVLIMLGSIFKIKKVEFDERQSVWIGTLSLCSDDDYELADLMTQMKAEVCDDISAIGWLFYKQGKYEKAREHF